MLIANFTQRDEEIEVEGLWQYDYGQKLQINGLDLPAVFEVHFAYKGLEKAIPQTGYTVDGVSVVDIPNSALTQPKTISAYIYLSDASQGETTNKILLYMNKRIAPKGFEAPEDVDLFHHTLEAVNEYAERTAESEKEAESWAHGHEDYPDRDEDNAKYYAEQAKKHVEHVSEDAKKEIDEYVKQKEQELKGEPGEPGTPGVDGQPGADGVTPHIGENGNWFIGEIDTGVYSKGADGNPGKNGENGVDGVTPHIGENGNWWIGEEDTGITAQGKDGAPGTDGQDGKPGQPGKSAYQYAQDGGYTGTEEEFAQKLAAEYPMDVQINGTSIVGEDGVAAIPMLGRGKFGLPFINTTDSSREYDGIDVDDRFGNIKVIPSATWRIDGRSTSTVITPTNLDYAVKSAMCDPIGTKPNTTNPLNVAWTDEEKVNARERMGIVILTKEEYNLMKSEGTLNASTIYLTYDGGSKV